MNKEIIEKLLLPIPKVRKGTKAKPSSKHKDKKREDRNKHKSE